LQKGCILHIKVLSGTMMSIWWLLWAFIVGGFSGMLLISLMVVARKTNMRGLPDRP